MSFIHLNFFVQGQKISVYKVIVPNLANVGTHGLVQLISMENSFFFFFFFNQQCLVRAIEP